MKHGIAKRIILILLSFLIAMVLGLVTFTAGVCRLEIPDISVDTHITDFVGRTHYTGYDLILSAEQYISSRIGLLLRAGSGLDTAATYLCVVQNCRLERLETEIGIERRISCSRRGKAHAGSVIFIFDTQNDRVTTKNYFYDGGVVIKQWQLVEVAPSIDNALALSLDMVDPVFFARNSLTEVTILAISDHWRITMLDQRKNITANLEIPFEKSSE